MLELIDKSGNVKSLEYSSFKLSNSETFELDLGFMMNKVGRFFSSPLDTGMIFISNNISHNQCNGIPGPGW